MVEERRKTLDKEEIKKFNTFTKAKLRKSTERKSTMINQEKARRSINQVSVSTDMEANSKIMESTVSDLSHGTNIQKMGTYNLNMSE